ncbi:hypothetical protein ACFE04_020760 [Oxalis oulophora]
MNKVIMEHFKVEPNGAGQFEVIDGKRTFMVNLVNRKCSCRRWCLSRVPCFHACANIFKNQEDPSNCVHSLLSKETCLATYEPRWPNGLAQELARLNGNEKNFSDIGFDAPAVIPRKRSESELQSHGHDSTTARPWFQKLVPPDYLMELLVYAWDITKMWATSSETRGKGKKCGSSTQ